MSTRRLLRLHPLALAAALGAFSLSAQAQWGLLQSLIQTQNNVAQQQAAEQAAVAAALPPAKRWENTKPVPMELQQQAQAFATRVPEAELRPLYERLYIEGERNATLNFKRIGLAALAAGHLELAEKALDAATLRIDQIYADNPEAQKAKSLWVAEKIKDFKGEPYERAMAYYYRGLVYSARNDFQNARAMFKQADYQDTVAEAEQYAGDFALMPYMAGWASYCDGNANLAKDYHQMAVKGDPSYANIPVELPVLLLFETGRAPFKYGAGKHAEQLKWQSHDLPKQTVKSVCPAQGGNCLPANFLSGANIGFQATTRGGRPIDSVLNGKASFKDGAQNVADVANTMGAVGLGVAMGTGNSDAAGLGLLGMFAGMVAQSVAASTQTHADIREWEQLPDTIWLATAPEKIDGELSAQLHAGDSPATRATLTRLVDAPSCQLYWGRSEAPLSTAAEAGPIEPGEHPRDPAFRKNLESQLDTQVTG
jgi:tetratricopeptide (TPR) repeat protein